MSINIKPANKGKLHEAMGIAKDSKIPGNRLKKLVNSSKKSSNTKLEKEAVFAENAKKWRKK